VIIFKEIYKTLRNILHPSKSRLVYVISISVLLNLFFGVCFYFLEKDIWTSGGDTLTLSDSIWWAMVTMTTVGYGDFYAKTLMGRFLISYPTMLLGIGLIGYLVGSVAEFILDFSQKKKRGLMNISFSDHIILCNYPGTEKIEKIICELKEIEEYANSQFVLITEKLDELPEELKSEDLHFVKGHPTNEEILEKANILYSSGVFILAEDSTDIISDERSYTIGSLIELMEKQYGKPIKTVIEVVKNSNLKLVSRTNADGVISSDGIASALLVQEFTSPGINDVFKQMMSSQIGSHFFLHTTVLDNRKFYELQMGVINHEKNVQVVGIIKNGKQILNPAKNVIINKGDKLIVISEDEDEIDLIESEIIKGAM